MDKIASVRLKDFPKLTTSIWIDSAHRHFMHGVRPISYRMSVKADSCIELLLLREKPS